MDELVRYFETGTNSIYVLDDDNKSLISVPKDLADNIKVFMIFKDKSLQEQNRNYFINEIYGIARMVNNSNNDALFIVNFVNNNVLNSPSENTYGEELDKIKGLVNNVYNKLLKDGTAKREKFIKKVHLVSLDARYNPFINWLCVKNPSKFRVAYSTKVSTNINTSDNEKSKIDVFINQNSANIFNEPNRQSSMMVMQSNLKPISESLSIGAPTNLNYANSNSEQYNNKKIVKQKTLVKKLPNNHNNAAFIKWYTTLAILLFSIVFGIFISVVLVK